VTWTTVWIGAALVFNLVIYLAYERHWLGLGLDVPQLDGSVKPVVGGLEAAKLFLTGYLVEKSLSMDNVFVIALIFGFFAVPAKYQHRVLFWGILGALVMRGAMIAVGAQLIHSVSWIIYVFGGFLVLTAIKMAFMSSATIDPEKNLLIRLVRRLMPVSAEYDGQKFFTRLNGRRVATPLFLALVMVEFTDLVFAVDSIPAIFAITADPFLVLTSNVFAILGLRALYFCLARLIHRFRYLKPALVAILAFVGVKMLLVKTSYRVDNATSLAVVLAILTIGVVASVVSSRRSGEGAAA
jgi:tellurite resistance protein TerC